MPVECTCRVCGAVFPVFRSRTARGGGKYCSQECARDKNATHGEARPGRESVEYKIWSGIKRRCLNPHAYAYEDYGGRGISLCNRWRDSYEAFVADVGRRPSPAHSIDRIDVNGDYAPGNVRWATMVEQQRNRRSTRLITFNGETRCMTDWAQLIGVPKTCLSWRLNHWPVERALTKPPVHPHA